MKNKLIDLLTRKLTEVYGESPATQIIALQIAGELLVAGMLSGEIARDNNVRTNADHIRSMSDEELAKILSNACLGCVVKDCKLHNYASYGCEKKFLEWLKQPAEEVTK